MDFPTLSSPPSILVHDHNGNHRRRRSSSRSSGMPFSSRPPGPMAIPNIRHDLPPPPLPPPRNIHDLTAGSDPGWAWGNDPRGGFGKSRESTATSSKFPKSWAGDMREDRKLQLAERPHPKRRDEVDLTIRSPTDAERRHREFSKHQDEGYYSLSGPRPPSVMSQQSVPTIFFSKFFVH